MGPVTDIELDVELLKKEVSDMKEIHESFRYYLSQR